MASTNSVTRWLTHLQAGDRAAAQRLWEGYFGRLVVLARQKLRRIPRRAADEEDVALSAFKSFCRGAELGRFPRLADRHDLWQVLVMITVRKAYDLIQHEGRARRDWRRVAARAGASEESLFPDLIGKEPDPAFAAEVAEECKRLLAGLKDEEERVIALKKMEGFTNVEIAAQLDCALSTVERSLRVIRKRWEKEMEGRAAFRMTAGTGREGSSSGQQRRSALSPRRG